MGKRKDEIWKLFNKKTNNSVSCKFCEHVYLFPNVNKMKNHIDKCIKAPLNAKSKKILEKKNSSELAEKSDAKPSHPSIDKFSDKITHAENVRIK